MTDNQEWWRFFGKAGFKRLMPDSAIQWAKARGYGWVKWYEPVCKTCHPTEDQLEIIVCEAETRQGLLVVKRTNGYYTISVAGVVKHPNISGEEAISALAHCLHGAEYCLMKEIGKV